MDYKIPFKGLKNGKHQFKFIIDDKFFKTISDSEIKQGGLVAVVELIKRSTGVELFFDISGKVKVPCDRCLDEFDCPIEYKGKLFFEFGTESEDVTDELVVLASDENYLDLKRYIYEFIKLSLPIQKFHSDEKFCNADMLAKLNDMIINNDDDKIDDPRWDKLRDLIN